MRQGTSFRIYDLVIAIVLTAITLSAARLVGPFSILLISGGVASWAIARGTFTEHRPRRLFVRPTVLSTAIVAGGCLWARIAIWHFQTREGFVAIGNSASGSYYEHWGFTVPGTVTGVCLTASVFAATVHFIRSGRLDVAVAFLGYALLLLLIYAFIYTLFLFEAFD